MNIFENNKKLEVCIYEGIDQAVYSRYDISDTFMPFMILYKDGDKKIVRLAVEGDPNIGFKQSLDKDQVVYDQIIMCFEGRFPHENEKHDAFIVKGFDTSQPNGLTFVQRFQGIESGKGFKKLGRLSLVSKTEALPVALVPRDTNKTIEEPYISGLVIKGENNQTFRELIAGHENVSILTNAIFNQIIGVLRKNESDFSGTFKLNFIPGMLQYNKFNKLIIELFANDVYSDPSIKNWEAQRGKEITLTYKFEETEEVALPRGNKTTSKKGNTDIAQTQLKKGAVEKPWWKFW